MLMIHGQLLVYLMMGNSPVGVVLFRYHTVWQLTHLLAVSIGFKSDSSRIMLRFADLAYDRSSIPALKMKFWLSFKNSKTMWVSAPRLLDGRSAHLCVTMTSLCWICRNEVDLCYYLALYGYAIIWFCGIIFGARHQVAFKTKCRTILRKWIRMS